MGFLTHIDIQRIITKHYDPANKMSRLVYKDPDVCIRFDFAIVDNNADPDKRGRLKVRFPHWGNVITNWVPMVRPYASKEAGIWMLPDVGTQVIWNYEDPYDNPIKQTAQFYFTVKSFRCAEVESGLIEFAGTGEIIIKNQYGQPMENVSYTIVAPDGAKTGGQTDKTGAIKKTDFIPGKHQIKVKVPNDE